MLTCCTTRSFPQLDFMWTGHIYMAIHRNLSFSNCQYNALYSAAECCSLFTGKQGFGIVFVSANHSLITNTQTVICSMSGSAHQVFVSLPPIKNARD
uniref:Uncharacterized protein n=1 Tax=Rhipicephalus appendiculatus TaxID=34631 RepID=A0A131YBP4_RHIAP